MHLPVVCAHSYVVLAKLLSLKGYISQLASLCLSLYHVGGVFVFLSAQPLSCVVFSLLKWSPASRSVDKSFVAEDCEMFLLLETL